jgi:rhodanese-related sulfurtransferase
MNFLKWLLGETVPSLTPAEAQARLKELYIVDVRQANEYQGGHIDGATLIPLNQLGQKLDSLPKDREILCVCYSGSRSSSAARQLIRAGLQATNLSGGMAAWTRAGLPVRKGKA